MPKAIAPGIDPAPLQDLIFHGGKVVPEMEFQNVYLGAIPDADVEAIDDAITRAMRLRSLNNVMAQYFAGRAQSCDPRASVRLPLERPPRLDEADVQALVARLYDERRIARRDLATTLINVVLPPGSILELDGDTSLDGLGGFHGSMHVRRDGRRITLYYSANVYSQTLTAGRENGIVAFARPWQNVVATLYHEINEFRTDADVNDAIVRNDNDFLGWSSRRGYECGDQPIFAAQSAGDLRFVFRRIRTSSTSLPIQLMYSNAVHGAEGPIDRPHA